MSKIPTELRSFRVTPLVGAIFNPQVRLQTPIPEEKSAKSSTSSKRTKMPAKASK